MAWMLDVLSGIERVDDRLTNNISRRSRDLRHMLLAAALLSSAPLLGGCVSAVDESNALGFDATPTPATPPVADAKPAESTENESVATAEASPSAERSEDPVAKLLAASESESGAAIASSTHSSSDDDAIASKLASAASSADGGIKPTALVTPASSPNVAAFAEKRNAAKDSEHSLYASLYTQSEAKTPLRNAETGKSRRVVVLQTPGTEGSTSDSALPGVDPKSLFEIGQRASVDSELLDDIGSSYQLASLSGIARLAPSGLLVQREDVVTNCFDTNLMGLISQIERRFKQKVVITSGFRSPAHNRRVNGAKASMHMACKAADLHVPGVNGLQVAQFVRGLPGRGGVGTYCHTAAIHVDVGRQRDWNWPCRRRQST